MMQLQRNTVADKFEAAFATLTLRDVAADSAYARDWMGDSRGAPLLVARPGTTEEVAAIVRYCRAEGLPMVAQGGHTGLVGAGAPSAAGDEVVVNLERMNRVRAIDPINFSAVVEAGCILEAVHRATAEHDLIFPLSLGAQGSCQIGGNVATNAGGINVLRYGMMRDLVLGLEVVLPDGRVWNGLKTLRKNNAGYDLKQLFLGSEGTLGIVTAAALKLFPRPTQVQTAFLAVDSVEAAMRLYAAARRDLADLLSAFELLSLATVDFALQRIATLRDPLATKAPFTVLMEVSASGLIELGTLVERFLELHMESGLIRDGALAASAAQARSFWDIREGVVEAQARQGRHLRTDVSIPISAIPAFMREASAAVAAVEPDCLTLAYGHVGDGNLHFNAVPPQGLAPERLIDCLERCEHAIFAVVDRHGGSISAEHGIGRMKRAAFLDRVSPEQLDLLRVIKRGIDPDGLMGQSRIFV
jgi:FAD/FMN-containing dehydrogenase